MLTKDKAGAHRGKWTWELSQKAETGVVRWASYRLYSTARAGSLCNNGGLVCFRFFYVLNGSFELQSSVNLSRGLQSPDHEELHLDWLKSATHHHLEFLNLI